MGAPEEIFLFTEGERLRQKERRGGKSERECMRERERERGGEGGGREAPASSKILKSQ